MPRPPPPLRDDTVGPTGQMPKVALQAVFGFIVLKLQLTGLLVDECCTSAAFWRFPSFVVALVPRPDLRQVKLPRRAAFSGAGERHPFVDKESDVSPRLAENEREFGLVNKEIRTPSIIHIQIVSESSQVASCE